MKEYYLVLHYLAILKNYNGMVYTLNIDHKNKRVTCDTDDYYFDIQDEYDYDPAYNYK